MIDEHIMSPASANLGAWFQRVDPRTVMDSLGAFLKEIAVIMVDADAKIIFWSRGAEAISRIDAKQAIGRSCHEVMECGLADTRREIANEGLIRGETVMLERADGSRIEVFRYGHAFYDRDGRFEGSLEVLLPRNRAPRAPVAEQRSEADAERFHGLLTRDPTMRQAFQIIRNVAQTDTTVLIRGESGSGKELVARALHAESHRRDGPFLAVNCAALTPTLLESELFGHVRGAFTGAVRDHAGLFQRADGGTLFLDEVAELPLELQAKLLRVLQERSFIPVGAVRPIHVDVRIVAATHRSLREEVKTGRFREDLMYRLRVVPIFLPALRERRRDITLLLWHTINRHNARGPRHVTRIDPGAMRRLLDYPWPGNVRELQNVVEYAFAVGRGEELLIEELPPEFREEPGVIGQHQPARAETRLRSEADLIRDTLEETGGKIGEAARRLGMSRASFWRKRKKHGV